MATSSAEEENVWVHAGNLDWHSPILRVEEGLRSMLLSILESPESLEAIEVQEFKAGKKRKPCDEDKLHLGYALIKCSTQSLAARTIEAIHGTVSELGRHKEGNAGERLTLTAATARARKEKSLVTKHKEESAAAIRKEESKIRYVFL